MSIPLVKNNEKDSINTSIIAIKRNIERINMLLGLVDSGSPDLSGLATKQELQDAITQVETDLAPVDEVTSGNMQSVTSNAVSKALSFSETPIKVGKFGDNDVYKLTCRFSIPQNTASGSVTSYYNLLAGKTIINISGSYKADGLFFQINGCWDASFTWGLSLFVHSNGSINYQVGNVSRGYQGYDFVNIYYLD